MTMERASSTQTNDGKLNNPAAVAYMALGVVFWSLAPLVIHQGESINGPFLFNGVWRFGVAVGLLLSMFVFYRDLMLNGLVIQLISRQIIGWTFFGIFINGFEYALFAWSTKFIDISVAAALFEIWPIGFILIMSHFREEGSHRQNIRSLMPFLIVAMLGSYLVIASQAGGFGDLDRAFFSETIPGLILVTLAAGAAAAAAFTFPWGEKLAASIASDSINRRGINSLALFGTVLGYALSNLLSGPFNIGIGLVRGEELTGTMFAFSILGGMSIHSLGIVLARKANLTTDNLGINAMSYATPVLSLMWLFAFAQTEVERWDYLVIGAAAIISANLIINFEAEVRFGFKALILALWSCGAFVYLRDDILQFLPFGGWLWPRETYLGSVGLAATVFILLLTFRVARLAPRTQDEDNRIFALHRAVELLARRNLIAPVTSEHVRSVDSARNPEELRTAYSQAKLCFVRAAAVNHPVADQKLLASAEAQLNMVVHSRQQGTDFGELFSLIIFGGGTVLLSLMSRPEVSGWTAFIYEVFSVLFPAVIVFLIVSVWDLHRDRADLVLAAQTGDDGYGVIFRDPRSRRFERAVSTVIGLGIAATYAGLLWYKWVG